VAYWVEEEEGHRSSVDATGAQPRYKIHPDTLKSALFLKYAIEKASAWYIITYCPEFRCYGGSNIGLRSFPWVAARYLTILKHHWRNSY
jgi:hypothetical protein